MHLRRPATALLLTTIILIAGLLTSCGGGDQSGGGSQNRAQQNGDAKRQSKGNAPEEKIALGTVNFVNPETERFTVVPRIDEQGKKPIIFKFTPKARVTLGGEEVKLEDMEKGQQAQVKYVVREDRNLARTVQLFEGGGSSAEDQGGEKTG